MGTLQDLLNKGQCKTGLLGCTKPCRVGQAGANQLGAALQERPWDPGGTQHGQEAGGHPFSKETPTPPGVHHQGDHSQTHSSGETNPDVLSPGMGSQQRKNSDIQE